MSSSQMPGVACFFTSAFMFRPPGRLPRWFAWSANLLYLMARGRSASASRSFNDAQVTSNTGERFDGAVELFTVQCSGHLRANACLALRHHGKGKADHIDSALQQLV